MPKIGKKRGRTGKEAQETSNTEALVEIPSDLSELSIPELKNLCRTLNFSCTGGRRVLIKHLENERDRLGMNTQQANTQAAQRNNLPSVLTVRECFSNDQVEQITQIVSQSVSSFFASQQPTQTSRVDDPPTVSPPTLLERLEQLGQFPFLSSSELQ